MRRSEIFWEAFWDGLTLAVLTGSSRWPRGTANNFALVLYSSICLMATFAAIVFLAINRHYAGAGMLLGGAVIVAGASAMRQRGDL